MVGKLLMLLAERDRLVLLPDLLEAYRERLLEHQNVVRAEVTTADAAAGRSGATRSSRAWPQATGRTVHAVDARRSVDHRRHRRADRQHGLRRQRDEPVASMKQRLQREL